MNKLLITYCSEFGTYNQYIRFDTRSRYLDNDEFACLKVKSSNEMIPFDSFEVDKDVSLEHLDRVINILNKFKEEIINQQMEIK